MLDFNHSKQDFWSAVGYSKEIAQEPINKMAHFCQLVASNKLFREKFFETPKSYQTQFILKEILGTNQEDVKAMFLAGHLLGAFMAMQKNNMFSEHTVDGLVKDFMTRIPKDKGDF